jgi:hypothetical protein
MERGAGIADVEESWRLEEHDTRHVRRATVTQRGDGNNKIEIGFEARFLAFNFQKVT